MLHQTPDHVIGCLQTNTSPSQLGSVIYLKSHMLDVHVYRTDMVRTGAWVATGQTEA